MFKILVAEDDAQLQQLFCRVLTRSGFTALGASDGVAALEILEHESIDLIISDIMMPRMDGYTLSRSLREAGNHIPVLMITAKDGFQDMQTGFLSGADDYMVKPINVNELVLRVNALLRRARMVAERRQCIGATVFDFDAFSVRSGEEETVLPQKEFLLLLIHVYLLFFFLIEQKHPFSDLKFHLHKNPVIWKFHLVLFLFLPYLSPLRILFYQNLFCFSIDFP